MDKTKLLKNIFDLAHQGIYAPLDNLPSDISKEVVEKNLLYIELKNLLKTGNNPKRAEEIKSILKQGEVKDGN